MTFLCVATEHVELGISILVLPYRPALPIAKWISTIQELRDKRLYLGIGASWMDAEFKALGIDKRQREPNNNNAIRLLRRGFDVPDGVVTING